MTNIIPESFSQDGTKTEPFASGEDDEFFFSTPALAQRLDLIQHLIEFSGQLVLVLGEEGSGKTALLRQLLSQASDLWRVCHIEAHQALDARALLAQVMDAYGFHPPKTGCEDLAACLDSLKVHLDAGERSNLILVLLVDDAQELPAETLTLLLSLIRPDEEHARPHLALFSEPALRETLDSPPFSAFRNGIMHILDIPGFTEEQTGDYIHQWMSRAGLPQEILLDAIAIHRLHAESKGLPGHINRLVRQALLENQEGPSQPAETAENSPLAHLLRHKWQLVTAAGLLAVASLLIVINLQTGDAIKPQGLEDVPLGLPLPEQITPKDELAMADGLERERASAYEPLSDEGTKDLAGEAPSPRDSQAVIIPLDTVPGGTAQNTQEKGKKAEQAPAEPRPIPDAQAPLGDPPSKQQAERAVPLPAATPLGTQPQPPAPLQTDSLPPSLVSGKAGNGWLQAQRPEYHVLQLFGTHDKAGLDDFLARHGLRGKAMPLATVRNGKAWYVAVYGPFPDRKKAQAAITALPPGVRALKPWPRTIASLRGAVQ